MPTSTSYRPSTALKAILALGHNLTHGTLLVRLPNGVEHRFGGQAPGPDAALYIHNDRLARRFLFGGNLGFCESYLDGDWTSPDMEALFRFFLLNQQNIAEEMKGHPLVRLLTRIAHMMRSNSKSGSRKNISYHYDLGNSFYETWLDSTMTYSSAVYDQSEVLPDAQRRKYELLARRMELGAEQHVLEIGCGWGGFAEFAAAEVGAKVTGITISREQFDYARRRVFEKGLAEKVNIELRDYRDLDGRFDRIASIEMFEAVGERYWPQFFSTVRERLKSGGQAALQIITIDDRHFDDYRKGADYIQKYIFPGGMLPSPKALETQVQKAGMRVADMVGFGRDYARTLREWNTRFQEAWPQLSGMGFDDRFKRMWEQYLLYCSAGFEVGHIDVKQVAIIRD